MRVFLDANLYISYLLKPDSPGAASAMVRLALSRELDILICDPLFAELRRVVSESPYVGSRVSQPSLDILIARLERIGSVVELEDDLTHWDIRDEDDRYILEAAIQGSAGAVVSGDGDLLEDRAKWPQLRISSASEFLAVWDLAKSTQ